MAGICLIRLGRLRPAHTPPWLGLGSENAAHRIAAGWDTPAGPRTGVYIPRRDTTSSMSVLVGGRLFPGVHHRADFEVHEDDDRVQVAFAARDGSARVRVSVRTAADLGDSHLFRNLEEASAFFESGSAGYSATTDPSRFDGLALTTEQWRVEPVAVTECHSTFFEDSALFPRGTATLDNALLMRHIPVSWHAIPDLTSASGRHTVDGLAR